MSISRQTRAVLTLAGVAVAAACSSGSAFTPQARSNPTSISLGMRFVDPGALKAQISVATYSDTKSIPVSVFAADNSKNKAASCKITSVSEGIHALGVDSSGNLWVPEGSFGMGNVLEFKPSCGSLVTTLTDVWGQAAGIAFASNGTAYVDNIDGSESSPGNVAVYPRGATKPSKILTNKRVLIAAGVGVDATDNLYLTYYSSSNVGGMLVFAGGKAPGKALENFSLGNPGVPTFDKKNNMVITDDSDATLNVYAPPYTGKPKTYPLKGSSPQCSFNAAQSNLACGDETNSSVDVYAYPSGKYQYSFNKGLDGAVIGVVQTR